MKKVKALSAGVLLFGIHSAAFAEDDLMSILEGKNSAPATQFVESEEVAKLKKAVNPSTEEQKVFFQYLADKNYEKALFQWGSAFNGSAFAATETGKALESFLKFKNGLKLTGVEGLLAIATPEKIDATVISLWKENLNDKDDVWKTVQVTWAPFWTQTFGAGAEMAVLLQKNYVTEDIAALTEIIKKTPVDSVDRSVLQWQLVLNLGIRGESAKAAQVLAHLMKAKNNPIDPDLMTLTAGRLLYQNGFLDAAIGYYEKISKKSDYWFIAQEEIAWSYVRKGQPQNAMAVTKTLTYPYFKGWVGIESYLLDSFSSLKVCDYSGVVKTMKAVRPQFRDHLTALEKLTTEPRQPQSAKLMKSLEKGAVSLTALGRDANLLPSLAAKDDSLTMFVRRQLSLETEAAHAAELVKRAGASEELQQKFTALQALVNQRVQATESAAYARLQDMAKAELEDAKQVMQRMQIVEVEMIQQVDSSSKLLKTAKATEPKMGTTGANVKYAMNYARDSEVWFDELSNFKVNVKKGCTQGSKE